MEAQRESRPQPKSARAWTSVVVAIVLTGAVSSCSKPATDSGSAKAPDTAHGPTASETTADPPAEQPGDLSDTVQTSAGPLTVIPIHHATLALEFAGKTIWLDPWSEGDLEAAPKADYIFITDLHPDHLDPTAVNQVKKPDTVIVGPKVVKDTIPETVVMNNGDTKDFPNFSVQAIPMYNLVRGPSEGKLYHDKGRGNGYLFTIGDKRIYVAGDTACTEEMRSMKDIDVAFVPMNLPYTMPPEEAAECVETFHPAIVYPYHYRDSDLSGFDKAASAAGIEVRLRDWY